MKLRRLFQNINKILAGGFAFLVTLIIGLIFWIWKPTDIVPLWLFVILIILCWFIWLITYVICSNKKMSVDFVLPNVRGINIGNPTRILIDYNELFANDSLVSIFYLDDDNDIEISIGLGYVETRNQNGYLQIIVSDFFEDAAQICSSLRNDAKTKRCLKIKPSIPRQYVGRQ